MSQLNVEFERVDVNILQGESHAKEFLAFNPDGRVPVLKHDNKYLAESNAILWYLASGSDLILDDKYEQAQILQWMFFEQFSHEPYLAKARYWVTILKKEEKFKEELKEKMKLGYAALDVMEKHLTTNDYFVGNKYSIADIALYAYTHVEEEGEFDLSGYQQIKEWFERIENQNNYIDVENR